MGGGNPLKKAEREAKRTAGKVKRETERLPEGAEKYGKEAVKYGVTATTGGLVRPGSEGIGGDVAEVASLGHFESGKTKRAKAEMKAAEKEQKSIIAEQKKQLEEEELKRKKRIAKGRQGRRSLLYAGGSETGVSQTLGG